MTCRKLHSSRCLGFESLEDRRLNAGIVAVSVSSGDLIVTGDSQANEVTITQAMGTNGIPVPGSYRVTGQNGTTITGTTDGYVTNVVSRDMKITLNGGADKVTLGDGVSNGNFTVPRDLIINSGTGDDSVQINRITVRDDAVINTGNGQDSVGFYGTVGGYNSDGTLTDGGRNDLQINTGADADSVSVAGGYVRRTMNINTEGGADAVYMQNLGVGDDVLIYTGTEDDKVTLAVNTKATLAGNVNVLGDVSIYTEAGNDQVSIDKLAVDGLFANLGSGDDNFFMSHTTFGRATINGGEGNDYYDYFDISRVDDYSVVDFQW